MIDRSLSGVKALPDTFPKNVVAADANSTPLSSFYAETQMPIIATNSLKKVTQYSARKTQNFAFLRRNKPVATRCQTQRFSLAVIVGG